MKCKRAKQAMALFAGRDLDLTTEQELRRHLTHCPGCHEHWNRISSTTSILHQARLEESELPAPQLWPNVVRSIRALPSRQTRRAKSLTASNVLVPMVAVASLMLAIVSINRTLSPASEANLVSGRNTSSQERGLTPASVEFPPILEEASWPPEPSPEPPPEPLPQPPLKRFLDDRAGYQVSPAQPQQYPEQLPGGLYQRED